MTFFVRPARPTDARRIAQIVRPYALDRSLISKELIAYFEDIQEFLVAVDDVSGLIIGCGALHVMWDDIAEIRTLAVDKKYLGKGVGSAILKKLLEKARNLELQRVFCLTFQVSFFNRHGFHEIEGTPVGQDVYMEMLRTHDDGVREFLDLAAVKPNTLGNTRMLCELADLHMEDPLDAEAPDKHGGRKIDSPPASRNNIANPQNLDEADTGTMRQVPDAGAIGAALWAQADDSLMRGGLHSSAASVSVEDDLG